MSHADNLADECVEWTGFRDEYGYGKTKFRGKTMRTHRIAWIKAYGDIPEGLWVLHRCDNPACVKPEHLFLGTHDDNMRDMSEKGRSYWAARTHCPHGHPYDDENTIVRGGKRFCRACHNARTSRRMR